MLDIVLDAIFPPRCGGCGARGAWLCGECRLSIRAAPVTACRRCRRLVSLDPCPMCEAGEGPDSMVAMARLEGPLREAVHRLKYGDRPQLAPWVAAATLRRRHLAPGVLVPVPLHPARRRRRGYNQAALLAGSIAAASDALMVEGLRRTGGASPQVGRGGDARRQALRGAFEWRDSVPVPAVVVVVDDVLTTGSTLLECALAARRAGVERVETLAVALG